MERDRLVPALVWGAIVLTGVAGVAAGTHLRDLGLAPLRSASTGIHHTSGSGDERAVSGETGSARAAAANAATPRLSRIVIDVSGVSRLEGTGTPASRVVVTTVAGTLASPLVGNDGRWSVRLTEKLASGEHRIATWVKTANGTRPGDDVRIFVPRDFRGETVVAYDALHQPNSGQGWSLDTGSVRRRAEELAVHASHRFTEVLSGRKEPERRIEIAAAEQEDSASPVSQWFDYASRTYQDAVSSGLSEQRSADGAARDDRVRVAQSSEGTGDKSVVDRLRDWFGTAADVYARDVARPLSTPRPGTASASGERSAAEADEAAKEARRRDEAERKAVEDARKFAEEKRRAEEALRIAQEKAAQAASTPEAQEQAAAAARRAAEERERQAQAERYAADAALKRAQANDERYENGIKKLTEAQEAEAARRAVEVRKAAEAARLDYLRRRAAAEAEAAKAAAKSDEKPAEAEKARRFAEAKAAAEKAAQLEAQRSAEAEAREREKSEREEELRDTEARDNARAAEAEKKAAASAERRRAAELAEDEAREREEYRILRRMIEAAKRKGGDEEAAKEVAREEIASLIGDVGEGTTRSAARKSEKKPAKKNLARVESWSRTGKAATCPARKRKARRPGWHLVKPSETLWAISRRHLGSGTRYNEIVRVNRRRISDPDVLRPCQWIRIPGKRRT